MIESYGDFAEHQEYQHGSERLSTSSMAHIAKVFLAPRAYSHKFSGRRIFAEASAYSFTYMYVSFRDPGTRFSTEKI